MLKAIRSRIMFRFITLVGIALAVLITTQIYQTQQSLAAGNIVLYTDNVAYEGNLGGRAGADAICAGIAGKPAGFLNYRAFISVDTNDEIQDMPTLYSVPTNQPIVGSSGPTIAADWSDLMTADITSLQNALSTAIGLADNHWTGSDFGGALHANNCSGWTTTAGNGESGTNVTLSGSWLDGGFDFCNTPHNLVCIAYDTVVTPPTAPTGLGATAASATQIDLAWTDISSNETGFIVERSLTGTGGWSVITVSPTAINAQTKSDTA